MCSPVCLSVSVFARLFVCKCVRPFVCLYVCSPVCLFVRVFARLFVCKCVRPLVCLIDVSSACLISVEHLVDHWRAESVGYLERLNNQVAHSRRTSVVTKHVMLRNCMIWQLCVFAFLNG